MAPLGLLGHRFLAFGIGVRLFKLAAKIFHFGIVRVSVLAQGCIEHLLERSLFLFRFTNCRFAFTTQPFFLPHLLLDPLLFVLEGLFVNDPAVVVLQLRECIVSES